MLIIRLIFNNSKFNTFLFALLYVFVFTYIWRSYCVPLWSNYNYKDVSHSFYYELFGYLIALLPILFYRGLKNVSSLISLLLYFLGYVPIILSLLFNFPENNSVGVVYYWIVLMFAMISFFCVDRIKYKTKDSNRKFSLKIIWILVAFSFILLLVTYHNNMRIVDFVEIYELREENTKDRNIFISYISSWAANFTFPFVLCYGLIKRNKIAIVIGSLLFIFLFAIFGQKGHLFSPLILIAMYKFINYESNYKINLVSILSISIAIFSFILLSNLDIKVIYTIASIFFMRTLTISGCLFSGYYVPFFQNHPYTYFTHSNVINFFFQSNPYEGESIGRVVAYGDMNANAIFWAMDGVVGYGVIGVLIISVIFFLFMIYFNSLINNKNRKFAYLIMVVPIMSLLNVSFFTFILSGGVLFVIILLKYLSVPSDDE